MSEVFEQQAPEAVAAFMKAVTDNADYPWNNDVVNVIGSTKVITI